MSRIDPLPLDRGYASYVEVLRTDPQPCVLLTAQGEVLFVNPAAAQHDPDRRLQGALSRDGEIRATLDRALKQSAPLASTLLLPTPEGDTAPMPFQLCPLSAAKGPALLLMRLQVPTTKSSASDQLHRVIEARKRSDKRFRQYLNSSGDAICAVDESGRITMANATLVELMGDKALIGSALFDRLDLGPVQQDLQLHDQIGSAIAAMVGSPHEAQLRDQADPKPVELTVTPILERGKRFFVVVMRDISTRTAFRETLARSQYLEAARDIARANEQTKTQFLATVSHEMRAPLGAVATASDLLLSDDRLPPQHRQLLEVIRSSADTALDQVNDTLEHVRLDLRPIADHPVSQFSPRKVLETLCSQSQVSAQGKGLDITSDIDCPAAVEVSGYHHLFHRVVQNLLSNAVKYTDRGRVSLHARLRLIRRADAANMALLKLTISDTGQGMDAGQVEKLFEPFETGDRSFSSLAQSAGLGMSIVERAVEVMGGKIEVRSTPGKGSSFTVRLQFALAGDPAGGSGKQPALRPQDLSGFRFLVVDDNPLNRQLMSKLVQSEGCTAVVAADGQAALDLIQSEEVDAVLMDIGMPGIDGLETTRRLKQLSDLAQIPVFGLTGFSDPEVRERAKAAGMCDIYVKPLRRNQLQDIVARIMHGQMSSPDQVALEKMNTVLNTEVARQIARISGDNWSVFVHQLNKECAGALGQIRAADAAEQQADFRAACRRGQTTAASVGALALHRIFVEIEELAQTGRQNTLANLLTQAEEVLEQTRLALTLL